MPKYVLVHEHEYGLDCYLFEFLPSEARPFPSEVALANYFRVDFEPAKAERLTVASVNNVDPVPQFNAEQIGTTNPCDSSLWDAAPDEERSPSQENHP